MDPEVKNLAWSDFVKSGPSRAIRAQILRERISASEGRTEPHMGCKLIAIVVLWQADQGFEAPRVLVFEIFGILLHTLSKITKNSTNCYSCT